MVVPRTEPTKQVEPLVIGDQVVRDAEAMAEVPEQIRDKYRKVMRHLASKGEPRGLIGTYVDVDTLQMALDHSGYEKGEIGDSTCWYENLTKRSFGYTARLETVKDNEAWRIIVSSKFDMPMVEQVEAK